jgi:ABC-type glycerol-3-phosphate transport system permease component
MKATDLARLERVGLGIVLALGVLPLLMPLVWMVSTSLKPEFEVYV